jgi:hypothetical protein
MIKIPRSRLLSAGGYSLIISPLDNEKYLVPLWIKVPFETNLADILVFEDRKEAQKPAKNERIEHIVTGSKGKVYSVVIDYKSGHSCSCPGFGFHKTCKHIKELITN